MENKSFFEKVGDFYNKNRREDAREGLKKSGRTVSRVFGIILKTILTLLLVVITTGAILGVFGTIYITRYLKVEHIPPLDDFKLSLSTFFYAKDDSGQWVEIESISGVENRVWVDYEEIPKVLTDAAVAIEDKRFWSHNGVDWKRTVGAFGTMLTGKKIYGGSTITQQLIKNLTLEDDVTVQRKLQEIFRALEFEKNYTKGEILGAYLNIINFGQGCYGVKTAAEEYFGKELDELTIAEAACLVSIPNSPYLYDPYYFPENNKKRRTLVLDEMLDQGKITQAQYNTAVNEEIKLVRATKARETKINSWYVDMVINDLTEDLMDRNGWSKKLAQQMISSSGYKIYTNMDMRIQKICDDVWSNEDNWPAAPDSEKPQSAMVITDPYKGTLVAIASARGEKTGNKIYNYATDAKRQPGSSIKPLTVYSLGFELGIITPYSVLDDTPFRLESGKAWPSNSPAGYSGLMTILTAVTQSKNTIAAKVMEKNSPQRALEHARDKMGLTTLVETMTKNGQNDIGLAQMALGGLTYGATVREMASAYGAFPNQGVRYDCTTYCEVRDKDDNIVFENQPEGIVAVKEKTAYYMTVCLQNAVQQGTGTGARLGDMPVAGKTGTTSKNLDRWFAGYSPYYVGVCWYGYEQPRKLQGTTNFALIMWKQVMEKVHEPLEPKSFSKPANLVSKSYCLDSGGIPTEACSLDPRGSRVATGVFDPDDVPRAACTVHKTVEVDTASGQLATPYCPLETRKRVALLDIKRELPAPGIVVPDEQYTVRVFGGTSLPDGKYAAAATSQSGVPYNTFCQLHSHDGIATQPENTATPTDITGEDPGDNPDTLPETTQTPEPSDFPDVTQDPYLPPEDAIAVNN